MNLEEIRERIERNPRWGASWQAMEQQAHDDCVALLDEVARLRAIVDVLGNRERGMNAQSGEWWNELVEAEEKARGE